MAVALEKRSFQEEVSETKIIKKQKIFSVKEFRHKLGDTAETSTVLTQFLKLCNSDQAENYIFQYINIGGNLLEILQLLENKSVDYVLVLDVAKYVLLQISIREQISKNPPLEACRYLLNTHLMIVNKMIGSTSNSKERAIILKLLTTMVTLSPVLGKDILCHVQFTQAAIDVLVNSAGRKSDNPRNAFVQFLTSFLLDGNYPLISLLLSKKNLLSSIISGLQYDQSETVCMVIHSLRQFILENPSVSKTTKMKTFSTPVVKDLVNLYNWKGPSAKFKQSKTKQPEIDLLGKAKVSDCLHDFLLVLCTSHKLGVIFHDDKVGLQDRRHQNALMYTILESLDRPWEHSYAGELVLKIAQACPDLVRTVWSSMREVLDPRPTKKWLSTIKYATNLSQQNSPQIIAYCAKELTTHQYSQLIQILASPIHILNTIIPNPFEFESAHVKVDVLLFLSATLRTISEYVNYSKEIHEPNDYVKIKLFVMDHVRSHYPKVSDILRNWDKPLENSTHELQNQYTHVDILKNIVQLFTLYSEVCPESLNDISAHCNLNQLFAFIPEDIEGAESNFAALKVSIIKLFYDNDPQLFLAETDEFATTLSLLLQIQHKTAHSYEMLRKLFLSTNIFDGCEYEVDIWINSIHAVKVFSKSISDFYITALRLTIKNEKKYYKILSKYSPESLKLSKGNYSDILADLQKDVDRSDRNYFKYIRHNQLTSFVLGCLNVLKDAGNVSKKVKDCFNLALVNLLHIQTEIHSLTSLLIKYESHEFIDPNVFNYIQSWTNDEASHVLDYKLKDVDYYCLLTGGLMTGDISSFLQKYRYGIHDSFFLKLIPAFYISNLDNLKLLTPDITNQCTILFDCIPSENITAVFQNPNLLNSFKPQSADDNSTQFIVKIAEKLSKLDCNKNVLLPFTEKVHHSIAHNIQTNGKESTLKALCDLLPIFKLNMFSYKPLLERIALLDVNKFINASNNLSSIYDLTVYCLSKNEKYFDTHVDCLSKLTPLDENTFNELTTALQVLNRKPESFNTSKLAEAIHNYLRTFPHNIVNVDTALVESIITKSEYCNENIELAVFILKLSPCLQKTILERIDFISNRKGVMLRIIDVITKESPNQDILDILFQRFEASVTKALIKPHKAGLHFQNYYKSVGILIEKCSSDKFARPFYEKVIKYDSSEGFLAYLLKTIFVKHLLAKSEVNEGHVNNSILTLTHVLLSLLRNEDTTTTDLNIIAQSLWDYFHQVKTLKISFTQTSESDSFRLFCRFALKIGISGQYLLLRILKESLCFIELADEDAQLLFDMTISHSEFLNVAHKTDSLLKRELFALLLQINDKWICTRKGDYIPIFLSSFSATNSESDITILRIFRLYESIPAQTNFYDYKPFIIGEAASNFYSIKPGMRKSLWRQPNMADTLQFIEESKVINTLKHLPKYTDFNSDTFADTIPETIRKSTYNLQFLLPLFTCMLAPENNVPTYMFSRSGGLSLTILALSSESKEIRHAACFVLSRYYHHLESKHKGKDHLLWLRFVQSLCRGLAKVDPIKLPNLVAIALAQMSLILTQPMHLMYTPLANYLTAKEALDVTTIPELYTFLNSSSVDAKEYRLYMLGLIQDGIRTTDDVKLTAKSMLFKLIMDMYHSVGEDVKIAILKSILAVVKIHLGAKILCESYSLISWLYGILEDSSCDYKMLMLIVKILEYTTNFPSSLILFNRIIDTKITCNTSKEYYEILIKCAIRFYEENTLEFDEIRIKKLLINKRCQYMIEYSFDSHFIEDKSNDFDTLSYKLTSIYLRRK